MTIREAIENLTSPPEGLNPEVIHEYLQPADWRYADWDLFNSRFQRRWIASWFCTDTEVGISVITLDGKPVAVTAQSGRKDDEDLRFLSKEDEAAVREAYFAMLVEEGKPEIPLIDPDSEIYPEWFERAAKERA